jgi:transposase-like protein
LNKLHKNAENFRLSGKQEQAILEFLKPTNTTVKIVSKKIGVTERTLYNWLNIPQFQDRLDEERRKIVKKGYDLLEQILLSAVECLKDLLSSEMESIRLRASQSILDYNIKIGELRVIEKRLRKLEQLTSEKDTVSY